MANALTKIQLEQLADFIYDYLRTDGIEKEFAMLVFTPDSFDVEIISKLSIDDLIKFLTEIIYSLKERKKNNDRNN